MSVLDSKIERELFNKGLEAFNNHSFYDAHEYWEDLWSDYKIKDPKFIQGLIQLSVGYFHITNLNIKGSRNLLSKCKNKLDLYRPTFMGMNLDHIIESIDNSLDNLNEIENTSDFNWELVPELRIDDGR